MKKKKTALSALFTLCSVATEEAKRLQKQQSFIITTGKKQVKINYWKLLRITVDGNYCYFHVRNEAKPNKVERHAVLSTLKSWAYLEQYGLAQVTPSCILNLTHVTKVEKHELFSTYLAVGIDVTESNKKRVAQLLPIWSGLTLPLRE